MADSRDTRDYQLQRLGKRNLAQDLPVEFASDPSPSPESPFDFMNQTLLREATDAKLLALIQPSPSYVPHFSTSSGGTIVSAQLPHELVRMLDIILVDPRFPMRTRSDIIREAAFHYLAALDKAFATDPVLRELIASEELINLMADLREKQDRLHSVAVSLRDMLCLYLNRGDIPSAMIALKRFYTRALALSTEERDGYLSLIRDLPVCRYVAWEMWDWPERTLPDSLLPVESPSSDGHTSLEGVPGDSDSMLPTALSIANVTGAATGRKMTGRKGVAKSPEERHAAANEYQKNYMRKYRGSALAHEEGAETGGPGGSDGDA